LKRRYKFLIWVATIWVLAIFPIWMLIPDPRVASPKVEDFAGGLLLVAAVVGGLIWVVWPAAKSTHRGST
jgi:hypothetical protein